MSDAQMFIAHVVSLILAGALLIVSIRRPAAGRALFGLLFLWASLANLRMALTNPAAYLQYAPLAILESYRAFILGAFARHVAVIVSAIALGQLAIAVLVSLRGAAVRAGLLGATVFLLAIAPLGIGSAFPATVIAALAAVRLMFVPCPRTLWSEITERTRRHPPVLDLPQHG